MTIITELIAYKADYIEAQKTHEKPTKSMGLSVALLLLTDLEKLTQPEEDKNPSLKVNTLPHFINSMQMALAIDKKNVSELEPTAQLIVKKLISTLEKEEKNQDLFIANLDDAITILEKKPALANNPKHVIRILKAINMSSKLSDEALSENALYNIDLPREGNEEFRFYFHREHFPNVVERRAALKRLTDSLVTIWNEGLSDGQLQFFLNSIQAGPCIEGATSEPLAEAGKRAQQKTAIPTKFFNAMESFCQQAEALLYYAALPPTVYAIKKLILSLYNGRSCLPNEEDPTVISDGSVQHYMESLQMFTSDYVADDKPPYQRQFSPEYNLLTRSNLLETILPYADAESSLEIDNLNHQYNRIISIATSSKSSLEIPLLISLVKRTGVINVPIISDAVLLTCLCAMNLPKTAQAILSAFPEADLTSWSHHYGTPLAWLAYKELPIIMEFMSKIDMTTFCKSVTLGTDSGTSALYWLLSSPRGLTLITKIFEKDPAWFFRIPMDALCRPKTSGEFAGVSPLMFLSGAHDGAALLTKIFEKDPAWFFQIPMDAFCRPTTQGNLEGTSPLFWLSANIDGCTLLAKIFEKDPTWFSRISTEAFCRPAMQGRYAGSSPLFILLANRGYHVVVKNIFQIHKTLYLKTTSDILNLHFKDVVNNGKISVLMYLKETQDGLEILKILSANPELKKIIEPILGQSEEKSETKVAVVSNKKTPNHSANDFLSQLTLSLVNTEEEKDISDRKEKILKTATEFLDTIKTLDELKEIKTTVEKTTDSEAILFLKTRRKLNFFSKGSKDKEEANKNPAASYGKLLNIIDKRINQLEKEARQSLSKKPK